MTLGVADVIGELSSACSAAAALLHRHRSLKNRRKQEEDHGGIATRKGSVRLTSATVLLHIISQLRPGADLSRVVLPTFILEPRSMLERITKYASTRGRALLVWQPC